MTQTPDKHRSTFDQDIPPGEEDVMPAADGDVNVEEDENPIPSSEEGELDAATVHAESEPDPLAIAQDKYLRLAAEFDNYRKRTTRDMVQAAERGQADLLKKLLDTIDDLARFAHLDPNATDAKTVVTGVEMVEKNLFKALHSAGLEVVDPAGLPFDPNVHEAVSTMPTDDESQDNTVAQVYQRGYLLKGQLLRPARVVVHQRQ